MSACAYGLQLITPPFCPSPPAHDALETIVPSDRELHRVKNGMQASKEGRSEERVPSSNGVNWNSPMSDISFLLLAGLRNCPSACVVSNTYSPLRRIARTIVSARALMEISCSSPTERMIGSTDSYSRSCQMKSFARSRE